MATDTLLTDEDRIRSLLDRWQGPTDLEITRFETTIADGPERAALDSTR